MKRIILILIIALIAMTTLLADTVTSQTSRDSRGRIHGYVYKSYYPNNNSGTPSWKGLLNEPVYIEVRDVNGDYINQYPCITHTNTEGYYYYPLDSNIPTNSNYTISVTCHGLTKTTFVNDTNKFDFYIDVEF